MRDFVGLSRLKLFFALSRTPHGILDLGTPFMAALLWLGDFPSYWVTMIGVITAFAGYTAVYALNDVIDHRVDREKVALGQMGPDSSYLDAVMVRHPLARGLIRLPAAMAWAIFWGIIALVGAYLLNPICIVIFLTGCLLEILYCRLLKITHLRTLVSGMVKTLGGLAAVFAVDPDPSPAFLVLLFFWLFFWEIGGQNIPADWTDVDEDRQIDAKTIPIRFGPGRANILIVVCLVTAVVLNALLVTLGPNPFPPLIVLAFVATGVVLLLYPAFQLLRSQSHQHVMTLFNRASMYPLAMTTWLVAEILWNRFA